MLMERGEFKRSMTRIPGQWFILILLVLFLSIRKGDPFLNLHTVIVLTNKSNFILMIAAAVKYV